MSSSILLATDTAAIVLTVVLDLLAAYRAIISRRLVTTPVYRNWALLTAAWGVLALPYEANLLRVELGVALTSFENAYLVPAIGLAGAVVGLALLDRTIRVGLNGDFFHRDILYWQRGGRIVTWTIIAIGLVGWQILNFAPAFFVASLAIYPLVVLAISTFRARDEVMLDYIRWFGLTVLAAVVATSVDFFTGSNFLQLFVGFFFYRAAGALSGSTFHMNLTFHFKAPRDFVYSVYTNPEMLTKITRSYTSSNVEGKLMDGSDVVNVTFQVLGANIPGRLVRKYTPPGGMEEEVTSGSGEGATRFRFLEELGGTRIDVSIDFEPRGIMTKFFGGLGARQARSQFERDFAVGRAYCESNMPR